MAKPKRARKKDPPAAPRPPTRRLLPMDLQVGDRIVAKTGEWEVVARPFTTAAGKNAHVRVRQVGQRQFTDLKSWGAQERISVRRAPGERG